VAARRRRKARTRAQRRWSLIPAGFPPQAGPNAGSGPKLRRMLSGMCQVFLTRERRESGGVTTLRTKLSDT